MEETFINTIIQGGAVGLAVLMIAYSYTKDKMFNKTLNNHFDHFNKAIDRNTDAMGRNTEVIRDTRKIMERVNNKLDR